MSAPDWLYWRSPWFAADGIARRAAAQSALHVDTSRVKLGHVILAVAPVPTGAISLTLLDKRGSGEAKVTVLQASALADTVDELRQSNWRGAIVQSERGGLVRLERSPGRPPAYQVLIRPAGRDTTFKAAATETELAALSVSIRRTILALRRLGPCGVNDKAWGCFGAPHPSLDSLIGAGKAAVQALFKDPNRALFRNISVHDGPRSWLVCGDVNGVNSFGAYVGYRHFVAKIEYPLSTAEIEPDSSATWIESWKAICW